MPLINRVKSLFSDVGVGAEVSLLGDTIELESVVEEGERRSTRKLRVGFVSGLPKADDPVWSSLRKLMQ